MPAELWMESRARIVPILGFYIIFFVNLVTSQVLLFAWIKILNNSATKNAITIKYTSFFIALKALRNKFKNVHNGLSRARLHCYLRRLQFNLNQNNSNRILIIIVRKKKSRTRWKPKYPWKNLAQQSREPRNSTHILPNTNHVGERRGLSALRQSC